MIIIKEVGTVIFKGYRVMLCGSEPNAFFSHTIFSLLLRPDNGCKYIFFILYSMFVSFHAVFSWKKLAPKELKISLPLYLKPVINYQLLIYSYM